MKQKASVQETKRKLRRGTRLACKLKKLQTFSFPVFIEMIPTTC